MNICYVVVETNKPGERIGIVRQGETGYHLAKGYDHAPHTIEEVETFVHQLNQRLGVPRDAAKSAKYASMFGWDVPVAAIANQFFDSKKAAT